MYTICSRCLQLLNCRIVGHWFTSFRKCRSLRRSDRSHQVSNPLNMKHSLCWDNSRTNLCREGIGTTSRWIEWPRGLSRRGGLRWADGRRTFWNIRKGKLCIRFVRLKNCFGQLDGLSSGGWTFISEKCLHLYSHQKLPRLASFLMRNNWEEKKKRVAVNGEGEGN